MRRWVGFGIAILAAPAAATTPVITRVADLPAEVRAALKTPMADAGAPWQVTDVIATPGLPLARLVGARRDGTTWTVDYERGGIAYSRHRLTLRLVAGRYVATDEWLRERTTS